MKFRNPKSEIRNPKGDHAAESRTCSSPVGRRFCGAATEAERRHSCRPVRVAQNNADKNVGAPSTRLRLSVALLAPGVGPESFHYSTTFLLSAIRFCQNRFRISDFRSCLVSTFFLFAFAVSAAPTTNALVVISPQQIVSNAVAYSQRLKVLDRDVEAATAQQRQARAQGLPQLSADAQVAQYVGLTDSDFGPAITIPAIDTRYGAGVQIKQPLYTGGRIKGQQASAVFRQGAARENRRGAGADVVDEALRAYWNWAKAFFLAASLQSSVERMEAHSKDIWSLYKAGLATDNDALATDVQLDRTRLSLDSASRRIEVCAAKIAFLTGQTLPADSRPQPAEPPRDFVLPPEAGMLAAAHTNRAERAAITLEAHAAEAQVKATRGEYYPQFALIGRYDVARPNMMNIPPTDSWQDDAFVGLGVTWNIFDWGLRKAKVTEASARSAQARIRVQQVEDRINLEVREARINLQDARQRFTVATRGERSAQRNLQAVTDLWQNGLARHSEVLDAHDQLTATQYEVISAQSDVELARAALDHALGRLNVPTPGTGKMTNDQ